jgi:hypothetical protein
MECQDYGIPLPPLKERFDRFDEGVEAITLLVSRTVSNYAGTYGQLTSARCEPKPVQRPYPPITIGGNGRKGGVPADHPAAVGRGCPAGRFNPLARAYRPKNQPRAGIGAIRPDLSGVSSLACRPDDHPLCAALPHDVVEDNAVISQYSGHDIQL